MIESDLVSQDPVADFEEVFDIALTTVIMLAKEKYGWNRHEWDLR